MNPVDKFLNLYKGRKNTYRNYKITLRQYFECIGAAPESYFTVERNYKDDVNSFFELIKDMAPITVKSKISNVKTFLEENDIILPKSVWNRFNRLKKGCRPLTQDRIPTDEELTRILTHMNAKGKALFLTLASSGMRIGECLQLKLDDIDLDSDPVKVTIPAAYTKNRLQRITFISTEAKEVLLEWLRIRKNYMKTADQRCRIFKRSCEHNCIFPYSKETARIVWIGALRKAELDEKDKITGRSVLHIHTLRKFFRTKLGGINRDITEVLMGHEGYLTNAYRRYTERDLAEFYRENESKVSVFSDIGELRKIQQEAKKQAEEIMRQHGSLSHMVNKNMVLENKVGELAGQSERITNLERQLSSVTKITKELLDNSERQYTEREYLVRLVGEKELNRLREIDEEDARLEYIKKREM